MWKGSRLSGALLWLVSTIPAGAQVADHRGTEYWLAFQENYLDLQVPAVELSVLLVSDTDTTVSWEMDALGLSSTIELTAGVLEILTVPGALAVTSSDAVSPLSLYLSADQDVTVSTLSRRSHSVDGYLAFPVDSLGSEHVVLSYPEVRLGPTHFPSQLAVVATRDATLVEIAPSVTTAGREAGVPFEVVLDRGEVYQLQSDAAGADLTGTILTSNAPVAVFSGHSCAFIPPDIQSCDHLVEQLPPVSAWGVRYLAFPLATRLGGDFYRILAATDSTTVTVGDAPSFTLSRGEYEELNLDEPTEILADHPILLAQFSKGTQADGIVDADPFMTLLPPIRQYLDHYEVAAHPGVNGMAALFPPFLVNFVNLMVPEEAVESVEIDGMLLSPEDFVPIGSSGFRGIQVPIAPGLHQLDASMPFGAIVYGFDQFTSYGHLAGQALGSAAVVDSLALSPKNEKAPVGSEHCVTAELGGPVPLQAIRVDFEVTGVHSVQGFEVSEATGGGGVATFCYTGTAVGNDTIEARVGSISDTARVRWRPEIMLTVTVDDGQTQIAPGETTVYEITVENEGPFDVFGARFDDRFKWAQQTCVFECEPEGDAKCSSGPEEATPFEDSIDLPAGTRVTYMATCEIALPSPPLDVVNIARVRLLPSANFDNRPFLAEDANRLTLSLSKEVSPENVSLLSPFTFTLQVSNGRTNTAKRVVVTDDLEDLSYVEDDCDGTLNENTNTWRWEIGRLKSREGAECHLTVRVDLEELCSTLVNTATVGESDPDLARNASATVVCDPNGFKDGGFEAGDGEQVIDSPFWEEHSEFFGSPLCTVDLCGTGLGTARPRTGDVWAWFGGSPGSEYSYVEQTGFSLPPETNRLVFWVWKGNKGSENDRLDVYFDGERLEWPQPDDPTADYERIEIPVDPQGATHSLRFELHGEGASPNVTSFSVDDVSFTSRP